MNRYARGLIACCLCVPVSNMAWAAQPVCSLAGQPMDRAWAESFTEQWAAHWNALQIDAVVAHLSEDAYMRSPLALRLRGQEVVQGREAIRSYWHEAYGGLTKPDLQVQALSWDPEICRLNIWWTANTTSGLTRASEFMDFGPAGEVVGGEAFYGK